MTTIELVMGAATPEDLFGHATGSYDEQMRAVKESFRRLAREVHPDVCADPRASDAFHALGSWFDLASRQIEAGTYGRRAGIVTIRVKGREYNVSDKLASGDISEIFRCDSMVLKAVRRPHDGDLIRHEAETLRILADELGTRAIAFVPTLVDSVAIKQTGGVIRQGNILERLDGFVTLEQVMMRKGKVDPRDMAWIWRRLLYILGATHNAGVIHGAVLPPHVMIHPEEHGLVLVDWCYSTKDKKPVRAVSRPYRNWYPSDVFDREPAGPELDVYMGARTMLALCGAADGKPPLSMPSPLRAFFRACLLPRKQRPDEAWDLQRAFDDVLERCYGPRKFRPFSMKGRSA